MGLDKNHEGHTVSATSMTGQSFCHRMMARLRELAINTVTHSQKFNALDWPIMYGTGTMYCGCGVGKGMEIA